MKRLFVVLLVLALTTLIARAADNTVIGVVTNVEPGTIVVKTDAGQTTSVECHNCHAVLKPKTGDCCVFCSYGSVKCFSA